MSQFRLIGTRYVPISSTACKAIDDNVTVGRLLSPKYKIEKGNRRPIARLSKTSS
jgi:hypothetical protein